MTIEETLSKFERYFRVHEDVGFSTPYTDQNGKFMAAGPVDPTLAPNGEPYVRISSFGQDADLPDDATVLFQSEMIAVSWWYDEVMEYASRSIGADWQPATGKQPHLYWRTKPEFHRATFLLMDQGGATRMQSPLAQIPQIELGFVQADLLISKLGPDGKEG